MNLEGNTVLVTGGTSGIGFELASQLLARRNTVIITGRDKSTLNEAQRKLPGLHTIRSDVRDPSSIASLCEQVAQRFPAMNVLINNAGVMRKINLNTFGGDLQDITQEVETNLCGPIRMVVQFLPLLVRQAAPAIVNVSSGLAFVPFPVAPIYGATKAGLHSFTQSLRIQLKQTNVKVFELAPPAIDTPMNVIFESDLKGSALLTAQKLVAQALMGLENDRMEIRVGLANTLNLMSRLAPGFILTQLSKSVDEMLAQPKALKD